VSSVQTTGADKSTDGNEEPDEESTVDEPHSGEEATAATLVDTHRPDHWKIIGGGALLAAGIGMMLREPSLLLVSVVAVGMLTVRQFSSPAEPEVTVSRSLTPEQPKPGESVEVQTTIRNVGERSLPDCRFVDRVPGELRVTDGSPRLATRLAQDEECTLQYEIEARSGNHRFDGVYAIVSDRAGANEHEYDLRAQQQLRCRHEPTPLQVPVLRTLTTPYAGRLATEEPGEGLEFYAVREYRTGDPLKRIDWNQYASSRELATLQFRTERSAAVVLLVDVRQAAYVRARGWDRTPADRGIEAAGRLLVTLLAADHRVGIATLGPHYWLSPSDGPNHRSRAIDALSFETAFSSHAPEESYPIRLRALQLLQRLTETTQIIICTPLVDDRVEVPIQMLESAGHEVTVLSPDPTRLESRSGIVATLERRQRINRIHEYGVPVIDWGLDTSLDVAVARTVKGWSE
jgi:uncharacterized protein (DUF58 family)